MPDEDIDQVQGPPPPEEAIGAVPGQQVDPRVIQSLMSGMGPNKPQGEQQPQQDLNVPQPAGTQSSGLPPALQQVIAAMSTKGMDSSPEVAGGLTHAQAVDRVGQPPKPKIGGLPGLIMDLIHPARNTVPGQLAPTKLDHFNDFLTNFMQSLSAGFAQEGHGPGSAMRGAAAAMQAPYQQGLQQYGLQQQARKQQADIDLEQQKIKTMTPSIPVTDPRTGNVLNIAPSDMGKYLAAGYRLAGIEKQNESKEAIASEKITPAQKAAQEAKDAFDKGDIVTYNKKIKEATQLATALKPGMNSPFGKLTPEMAATGMPPNYQDSEAYPLGLRDPKFKQDVKEYGQKVTALRQKNAIELAKARGESYAYGRAKYTQIPVLDQDTSSPTFKTPLEIAASVDANGGISPYLPLNEGDKLMMKNAIFEDIKGAANNLRKAVNENKDGFSPAQVAQMSLALDRDPSGGMLRKLAGELAIAGGKDSLNDAQQKHVIAMAQAVENAYALRSVAGFGTGSDELRAAIKNTLPSPSSPTGYSIHQLDAFDAQVNRLQRGVAKVRIRGESATPQQPSKSSGGNTNKDGFPIIR